jgi:8-oxo-dGTP diphosphatase
MTYTYKYPRAALTVDMIIFFKEAGSRLKVLLIQRDRPPFEGQWAFPGGFVNINETLKQSAKRELKEETCLENIKLKQFYTFDAINRDPRHRTISVVYYGFAKSDNIKVKADDDARDAKWFYVKDIPDLAFDHNDILKMALKKITNYEL